MFGGSLAYLGTEIYFLSTLFEWHNDVIWDEYQTIQPFGLKINNATYIFFCLFFLFYMFFFHICLFFSSLSLSCGEKVLIVVCWLTTRWRNADNNKWCHQTLNQSEMYRKLHAWSGDQNNFNFSTWLPTLLGKWNYSS